MSDSRVLSAQPLEDEIQTELSLRPKRLRRIYAERSEASMVEQRPAAIATCSLLHR